MKIKKIIPVSIITILLFGLIIYIWNFHSNNSGYIKAPNIITVYYKGEQKQIVKNSGMKDSNGEDLYKIICDSLVFKIPEEVGEDKFLSEKSNEIKVAKESAVGFIYNKPKKITAINNKNSEQVQYTEILFVLDGKFSDSVYVKTRENSYLFVGLRNNLSNMIKNLF